MTYFNGHMPIFLHAEHDVRTFRMIMAQFCVNGNVTQMEIVRAFGVSVISVKRAVQRYWTHGPSGFYAPPRRRGAAVLTSPVLIEAQRLLDAGQAVGDLAMELGIKANTLAKAVHAGRVHRPEKKAFDSGADSPGRTKSARSATDSAAPMGMGATHELARVAASLGQLEAVMPVFHEALDVPNGVLLLALTALPMSMGQ